MNPDGQDIVAPVLVVLAVAGLLVWGFIRARADDAAFSLYVVEHHCVLKDKKTGACYSIGDTMHCDSDTKAYLCDGNEVIVR